MKKREFGIYILIIAFSIFFLTFVFAAESQTDKINKAFICLDSRVNESAISLQEAIFSALADVPNSKINATINAQKSSSENCWPASACSVKETAQVVLAKNRMGQNTSEIEKWLISKSGTTTELIWFLQTTIDNNVPANCSVKYDLAEQGYKFSIGEDMKIKEDNAGNCLARISSGYWLQINNNCLDKRFDVSCEGEGVTGFKTNLLYQKNLGGTIYVSANTHGGSANGWTTEKITALCFKKGNVCDYESSLWATTALYATQSDIDNDDKKDYEKFVPYLKALAEESNNEKFFPSAFLMYIVGRRRNGEYYDKIIKSFRQDPQGGYWPEIGSPKISYDNTALALIALGGGDAGGNEVQQTLDYLFNTQTSRGCWNNNNIKDTAFIIYSAGWLRNEVGGIINLPVVCGNNVIEQGESCEGTNLNGQTCQSQNLGAGNLSCYAPGTQYECRFNTTSCQDGSVVPPPPVGEDTCAEVNGTCKAECGENETTADGFCASDVCCVQEETQGPYNPNEVTACVAANYYCAPDDYACLSAGGETLPSDLYPCESFATVCCTVEVPELKNCAEQGGKLCADGEECSGSAVEASDRGTCCVGECSSRGTRECTSDSDCGIDEICSSSRQCVPKTSGCTTDADCSNGRKCTNGQCVTSTGGSTIWIWIVVLVILIGAVVLGIIYRNKLRLWLFKRGAGKGREFPKPGWPPGGTGAPVMRRMPPRFGPPVTMRRPPFGAKPITRAAPATARATPPPSKSAQASEKDKEMEETLKKLKEMSK